MAFIPRSRAYGITSATKFKVAAKDKTAFIFLDIVVLREYLELGLNAQYAVFTFNLETVIDG